MPLVICSTLCQPVPELWIHPPRLAAQQRGQFVQRRLHAAVEPLVNVPILVGESRAVLHIGHQQFRRAGEVARGLAVVADGLARLSQLQFAKASCGKELLHDLAPIPLQDLAAALSGLTAGMDKVAVLSRPLHKGLSPGRAARASPRWRVVGGPRSSRQVSWLLLSWFEWATNHGTAFFGKPVFLLAAARLIGNGHFQQSGIERWLQVCLDKVVPMAQTQFFLKFGSAQCSITNSQ